MEISLIIQICWLVGGVEEVLASASIAEGPGGGREEPTGGLCTLQAISGSYNLQTSRGFAVKQISTPVRTVKTRRKNGQNQRNYSTQLVGFAGFSACEPVAPPPW